ncbi:TonB-dependent receptor [Bacteroides ovatus]|nr:TonB-dependent receptor [Bacteroides ovatus]
MALFYRGYYQSQIGNDKLRWERTTQTNVGLDFSFLNGRMTLTADAYYKKTTDLLLMVKLPSNFRIRFGYAKCR